MNILLVDDEAMMRVSLKVALEGFPAVENIYEAADGEEALRTVETHFPDVVITDIRMPRMDGIALIRNLTAMNPRPRILVLSNYSDFALVKESMKLGADDYLLKLSYTNEQLADILSELFDKRREDRTRQANQAEPLQHNQKKMQRVYLRDLLLSDEAPHAEGFAEMQTLLALRIATDSIACVLFRAGTDKNLSPLLIRSLLEMVEEVLRDTPDLSGHCIHMEDATFALLLSPTSGQMHVAPLVRRLHTVIQSTCNRSCMFACGGFEPLSALLQSMARASLLLHLSHAESTAILLDAAMLHSLPPDICTLNTSTPTPLAKALDAYIAACQRRRACGLSLPEDAMPLASLSHMESPEALHALAKEMANFPTALPQEAPYAVRMALSYIHDHYAEAITLSDVATVVHLEPTYFSKLFRQTTGVNYMEYVTNLRIERACTLLSSSNMRIYEIARRVGYQESHYFNRIFKKTKGITPLSYRNQAPSTLHKTSDH